MTNLNEIRARLEAATPGPWRAHKPADYADTVIETNNYFAICVMCGNTPGDDTAFITHAPQDVAALLAEIDQLRAANAELVAMLDTAAQFIDVAAWSGQTFEESEAVVLRIEQAIAKSKGEADNGN